jgi:uncharacterized circularly permuted ATP-grasp superfamily protein
MDGSIAGSSGSAAWNEMYRPDGTPRPGYASLHQSLARLTGEELRTRVETLARTYVDQGVTFDLGGEERPFPLDVVPRIITAAEWGVVERGVAQRVKALEAFLADAYGARASVADGVIPLRLLLSSAHFHREAAGIEPANGVRVHVAWIDLVRDSEGTFRVLEDNIRVPSASVTFWRTVTRSARCSPRRFPPTRSGRWASTRSGCSTRFGRRRRRAGPTRQLSS